MPDQTRERLRPELRRRCHATQPPPWRSAGWGGESHAQRVPADPQSRAGPGRGRDLDSVSGVGGALSLGEEPRWSHPDENGSIRPPALGPGPSPMYPAGHSQCGYSADRGGVPRPYAPWIPSAPSAEEPSARGGGQERPGCRGRCGVWGKEGVGTRSLQTCPRTPSSPAPAPLPAPPSRRRAAVQSLQQEDPAPDRRLARSPGLCGSDTRQKAAGRKRGGARRGSRTRTRPAGGAGSGAPGTALAPAWSSRSALPRGPRKVLTPAPRACI